MATVVIMPRQGQSVESCIISKWHKSKGDSVKAGDILFSYETDKASFDEEASVEGILLDVFFEEGDDVPCLTNVCVIGNEGESTDEFNPNAEISNEELEKAAVEPADKEEIVKDDVKPQIEEDLDAEGIVKISPRARNLAEKTGVDYRAASPSGPYGRIIENDIVSLKESGHGMTSAARQEFIGSGRADIPDGTGIGGRITTSDLVAKTDNIEQNAYEKQDVLYEEVKISNIRKVIAKAMHHSITSTCQLTLNSSFDATEILSFRKKVKQSKEDLGLQNITINDIILFAVSRTLLNHKDLNAHFLDDKMGYFKNVNLGVAVDTERGLMVPTIFNSNMKSLNDISREAKDIAKQCQIGTISPDILKGGSFTVTNLGTLGIESFTPVLNPPQTGILGVNTIVQQAKEVDGEYRFYPAMGLSLTFDHRAVDGAPAAKFLQELKRNLENFSVMLAK